MRSRMNIYAYKHGGIFHRVWKDAMLLKETKNYYIVATPSNTRVFEKSAYRWTSRELAINYFSKKHWFNVILMYKPDEEVYYCNLATPCIRELNDLKYIDYDIDVKYFCKSKKMRILDMNEYRANSQKYEYDEWIDRKIKKELNTLKFWIENEIGPFSKQFRKEMLELYKQKNETIKNEEKL